MPTTIDAGMKLGPYEILSPLGAGGMGEVYRARDTRLNREVAIKVLPRAFAEDPLRMARFEREAQLLASLNHPRIAAIYGLEESGATRALVMELVEGPTLAERIGRTPVSARPRAGSASPAQASGGAASGAKTSAGSGAKSGSGAVGARKAVIPLDEALPIAQQVAESLEYAHEHGVVHRDLKPANIKVTPDGEVKVLDFGLAKAMGPESASADISNSPTLSLAMTEAGLIIGTAAYMAPEQAKGRPVDRRADIWAFGCVLYEMLSGQKAFDGETVSDVLAAVIMKDPDWAALPQATPAAIQRLIRRCLQKDVRQRLQAIGDARIAIEETLEDEAAGGLTAVVAAAQEADTGTRPLLRSALPWTVALVSILTAATAFLLRPSPAGPPLRKFEMSAGKLTAGLASQPEISPNGKAIAYLSGTDLLIRNFDQLQPRKLYSLARPEPIFWSPDSETIGFANQGKLWRIAASGGAPMEVCPLPGRILSGAWGADGTIYFSAWRGDIYTAPDQGGDAKALGLQDPKTVVDFHDLSMLPGGRDLLYVVHLVGGHSRIGALKNGKQETVFSQSGWDAWQAKYSPTGHLLFLRDLGNTESIWAVPFSLSELKTTGQPFMVTGAGAALSTSSDGTLLYVQPAPPGERQLVWVSRSGKIVGAIGEPQDGLRGPAVSPDGKRVAAVALDESGVENVFLYDVASGARTPLLSLSPQDATTAISGPLWTADGKNILFTSLTDEIRPRIVIEPTDGSREPHALLPGVLAQLSPEGDRLAYTLENEDGTSRACYATFSDRKLQTTAAKPLCLPAAFANDGDPRISPDGRYVAFVAQSGGQDNVYITHFPDGNGRWQVSTNGGFSPVWSPSGNELFYLSDNELMSVKVTEQPSLSLSAPISLFSLADRRLVEAKGWLANSGFDFSVSGQNFLMVQRVGQETQSSMIVDQNWFAQFSKKSGN